MKAGRGPRMMVGGHGWTGLRAYVARFLPDATGEEAHRARILVLAALVFTISGAGLLVFQSVSRLLPLAEPDPWGDMVLDALVMVAGLVVLRYVRAGRLRPASWMVLGCLLLLAAAMISRTGNPSIDVTGALVLLLFIALAGVLLPRGGSWLAYGLGALTYLGLSLLWAKNYLPPLAPVRDSGRQASFLALAWLVISGIVTAVITSTMVVLREQARLLLQHNRQLQAAEDALRALNEDLEDRIQARTAELARERGEAERAREAAEAATRAKSEFLATVSHEVRTPMSAVLGTVYLALNSEPSPRLRAYLMGIRQSSQTMLAILNDLLDASKIEAGKLDLEAIPFDLREVLDHVLALTRVRGEEKGLDIHLAIAPEVPIALIGDPLRLEQILANLATNAVKFTDHGEVGFSATVHAQAEGQIQLRFSVRDTGIGMTPDEVSRLFQAFSQSDGSITRRFGGTGLGLLISKELVSLMGGEIWVASAPERGSTFFFTATFGLPEALASPERGAGVTGVLDPGQAPAAAPAFLDYPLCGSVVLLADDSEMVLEVTRGILELAGAGVVAVKSGPEVLAGLARRHFDAVLVDIEMPEMDGYAVAQAIRASNADWCDIPIVALTGRAGAQDRERSLAVGMNDYLTKPLDPQHLCATVARWVAPHGTSPAPGVSSVGVSADGASGEAVPVVRPDGGAILAVADGLARAGGDSALYYGALRTFRVYHAGTPDAIRTALAEDDAGEARRLAHKLKGAAATIGAERLQSAIGVLEQELGGVASAERHNMADRVDAEMGEVLRAIAESTG